MYQGDARPTTSVANQANFAVFAGLCPVKVCILLRTPAEQTSRSVLHCRQGMQADFTVLDGDLLEALKEGGSNIPAVRATYVNGKCSYGCSVK